MGVVVFLVKYAALSLKVYPGRNAHRRGHALKYITWVILVTCLYLPIQKSSRLVQLLSMFLCVVHVDSQAAIT